MGHIFWVADAESYSIWYPERVERGKHGDVRVCNNILLSLRTLSPLHTEEETILFSVSFVFLPASFCNRFLKGRRTANHQFEPGPSLVGRVWCLCSESSLPYRVSLLLFSDLLQKAHLGRVLLRAGLATLLYLHQDRCQTKACPQVYNQPFSVEKKTPGSSLEPPSLRHLV